MCPYVCITGNALIITAKNFTLENVYVSKIEFNGKPLDMNYPFMEHSGKEFSNAWLFNRIQFFRSV